MKKTQPDTDRPDATLRRPWQKPTVRKLWAGAAESSTGSTTEGSLGNS
jgi:hypothetical protein